MPVYQFVCLKHGEFEKITIKAEWDAVRCPKCGRKPEVHGKTPLQVERLLKNTKSRHHPAVLSG
jgi:putative FmdB family regulatory protein